jgi:hypothetical protein
MSPTSYQTAPPRISIINNGRGIVKLSNAFAASAFFINCTIEQVHRIQRLVPGIEQALVFVRRREKQISAARRNIIYG